MASTQEFIATGRRKTSVARIRMTAGSGKIDINGKSFEDYFPTIPLQNTVLQPLQVVKLANSYDLSINTTGGGATGQAGAARLAIANQPEDASRLLLQMLTDAPPGFAGWSLPVAPLLRDLVETPSFTAVRQALSDRAA